MREDWQAYSLPAIFATSLHENNSKGPESRVSIVLEQLICRNRWRLISANPKQDCVPYEFSNFQLGLFIDAARILDEAGWTEGLLGCIRNQLL
jgi:hypothetical protein